MQFCHVFIVFSNNSLPRHHQTQKHTLFLTIIDKYVLNILFGYVVRFETMNTMLLMRSKEMRECEIRCCCFCACTDESVKYKQTTCENMLNFLQTSIIPTPYLFTYLTEHSKRLLQTLDTVDENDIDDDTNIDLFTLCVNCDSWIRRQASKEKSYLHADAIFLNILFPGRFELPEERSCLRVVNNACLCNDGFNFLQSIAPVVVQEFFAVFSEKYVIQHKNNTPDTVGTDIELITTPSKIEHWHILSPDSSHFKTTQKHRRQERRSHIKNKLVYIWWQRNRRCEFLSNKYTAKLLRHIIHGMP
jgi:hypothetical protein